MNKTVPRHLTPGEAQIVMALAPPRHKSTVNNRTLVEDLADGGMGSIRFVSPTRVLARGSKEVARAEYVDNDGVLVSITLSEDADGDLFELDFWKTDFSALRRYPAPADLKSVRISAETSDPQGK